MHTLIQCLATHTERLATGPLSPAVQDKAILCLTDFLAATLSAHGSQVDLAGQGILPLFGQGACVCIGLPQTGSAAGSTFYNALVATAEDLDDAHRFASGLHMSAVTFPALLALSSTMEVTGERFIRAVAAGYEASSRVVRAADAGLRDRGYHSTGAAGVFGACAATCVLLGLTHAQTCHALGIAASGGGGLFAFLREGSSVRHAHAAWAGLNGLSAALLARDGLTGPLRGLEGYDEQGRDGYFRAYAGTWDESFIRKEGSPEILNAYHKLHAACGHAAPAITAVQMIREELRPEDPVEQIVIKGYKASAALSNPDPRSVAEAKFSLPVITAIVLDHGKATLAEMTPENVNAPATRAMAAKVKVVEDAAIAADFPRLRACEVDVTLHSGHRFTRRVDAPLGMPENPVGPDVIEAKFRTAAKGIFDVSRQDAVLRAVRDLPSTSPSALLTLLRKGDSHV